MRWLLRHPGGDGGGSETDVSDPQPIDVDKFVDENYDPELDPGGKPAESSEPEESSAPEPGKPEEKAVEPPPEKAEEPPPQDPPAGVPDKYKVRYALPDGSQVDEEFTLEELSEARRQQRLAGAAGRKHGEDRETWEKERRDLTVEQAEMKVMYDKVAPALDFYKKVTGEAEIFNWLKEQIPDLEGGTVEVPDPVKTQIEEAIAPFKKIVQEHKVREKRQVGLTHLQQARTAMGYTEAFTEEEEAAIYRGAKIAGIDDPYQTPMMPTIIYIALAALNGDLVHKSTKSPDQTIAEAAAKVDNAMATGAQVPPPSAPKPQTHTMKKADQYDTPREYYIDAVRLGKVDKAFANEMLPDDQQIV